MTGVGDDMFSYCWDPIRKVTFWDEKEEKLGQDTLPCEPGHVVGCCFDLDGKTISFYYNGDFIGTPFTNIKVDLPLFAGFTIYHGDGATAEVMAKAADFKSVSYILLSRVAK